MTKGEVYNLWMTETLVRKLSVFSLCPRKQLMESNAQPEPKTGTKHGAHTQNKLNVKTKQLLSPIHLSHPAGVDEAQVLIRWVAPRPRAPTLPIFQILIPPLTTCGKR